ncbi:MAG: hypothetical protein ACQETK_10315 [Pseudomonadota bacterium]
MPALTRAVKQMPEGLAYAHLAEMQLVGDKHRSRAGDTPPANPPSMDAQEPTAPTAARRRIGLFLGPFASRHMFDYAADSCEHLDADLVVLTFLRKAEAQALIEGLTRDATPLPHGLHIETLTGDPERALRRVLERGIRLDFLVCDEQGCLDHHNLGTEMAAELPVVMFAATRTPARDDNARTARFDDALPATG